MDHSISGDMQNAKYIDANGFFVGNHSIEMRDNIEYLINTLKSVKV